MKIYKHGTVFRFKEYRIICPRCNCDFSYMLQDLSYGVTFDSESKELIKYKYIKCPECFELILIENE